MTPTLTTTKAMNLFRYDMKWYELNCHKFYHAAIQFSFAQSILN